MRAWAQAELFRRGPPAPPLTAARALTWAGLTVAGVAVVLLRTGGDPLAFLWAEDGGIFLEQALNDEDVRVLEGLDTGVGESDTLVILPAMAGGAGPA